MCTISNLSPRKYYVANLTYFNQKLIDQYFKTQSVRNNYKLFIELENWEWGYTIVIKNIKYMY